MYIQICGYAMHFVLICVTYSKSGKSGTQWCQIAHCNAPNLLTHMLQYLLLLAITWL